MSEILRQVIQEQQKENKRLNEQIRALTKAGKNICDRWVSPDMYPRAMEELTKAIEDP